VALVSLEDPSWEAQLATLEGAVLTDVSEVSSSGLNKLESATEDSDLCIVLDIPEVYDPAGCRFVAALSNVGSASLAVTSAIAQADGSTERLLRRLALAQLLLLWPLWIDRKVEVEAAAVTSGAFAASLVVNGLSIDVSGAESACPAGVTEAIVLADGGFRRLALVGDASEVPSELLEISAGQASVFPASYSAGRRAAWIDLHDHMAAGGRRESSLSTVQLRAALELVTNIFGGVGYGRRGDAGRLEM
jgi:hypothetical protein